MNIKENEGNLVRSFIHKHYVIMYVVQYSLSSPISGEYDKC